jgi:hypothetical protein
VTGRNYSNKYSRVPIGLQPASKIDGGQFVRAMEKAGMPTDTKTLNKIVRLVNSGKSVAQAILELKQ